jgi:Ca-activated chloride channel family protein
MCGATAAAGLFAAAGGDSSSAARESTDAAAAAAGTLTAIAPDGQPQAVCPLEHTDVRAEISGFLARVRVTQRFRNNLEQAIEAVYTFPLPADSAVDDMTIRIGERTVKGKIKERDEARRIYNEARARGNLAALLDQERPNIFTQAVANIPPGATVEVEIAYVETLRYEEGAYDFSFPMVVGPRYVPGSPTGKQGGGWAPDTDQVPDASRVTPPVTPPGTRAGHDVSVEVLLDAGVPIRDLDSGSHDVEVARRSDSRADVRLKAKSVLPNKHFRLRYAVAGETIDDAVLTHFGEEGGFFTMILQPPKRVTVEDVTPKELVFVLDTSGSMSGFPIEKAKETMKLALDGLYPRDTFNLITFSGDTKVLFPTPVPATPENLEHAQRFLAGRQGGGGTEMMQAIRTALKPSESSEHVRIVCFMTDGYVGNDMAILDELGRYSNARVFSFGVGSSPNRFLLDKMAEVGRGEVEYVSLQDDGSAAARRFHERVRTPLLTDIALDFGSLAVEDVYPKRIPDLFSAKPLIVKGRFTGPGRGKVRLSGRMSGRPFQREISVELSREQPANEALGGLWARAKISDLMGQDWAGMQNGAPRADIKQEITRLGLTHRLMTQFTSFVAVEETVVTEGGKPRRIEVPVELPEGVSYEGVFGDRSRMERKVAFASYEIAGGVHGGSAGGMLGGVLGPAAQETVAPPPPPAMRTARPAPLEKLDAKLRALAGRQGLKVDVEIWLTEATPGILAKLKALGFELSEEPRVAKIRAGRISADKLADLAALDAVRYVKAR